ncbi:MAG: ComEC/Rec2 family competence protein [Candidatus Omnitrophica bacterium]|nr:ComEC/Rec2 family competence protein [Candidatus Omnitrophota bacterium]
MQHPLVILALFFSLGISAQHLLKTSFFWLFFTGFILLVLYFLPFIRRLRNILLCCTVFLCGAAAIKNSAFLSASHISRFIYYKNHNLVTIRGVLENQPEVKNNRSSFILLTREIRFPDKKYFCCGTVLVRMPACADLNYGEEVILRGNLYRLFSFGKNSASYAAFLNRQGIYCQFFVLPKSKIIKLPVNKGFFLKRFSLRFKGQLEKIIFAHCSPICAAVVDAMVLGEKKNIPPKVYNAMMKSGTVHILVVSGFNVGIVAFLILLLLKLSKIPRKARIFIAIILLIIYCLVTGASNPVVRATVMGTMFLWAYVVKREPDIYNSSALAAVFILMNNPNQLFDIGFQLSFASVVSIVYLYPKFKSLLHLEIISLRPLSFILEGLLVSFSAWIGTMGLILYYFRIFSPVAVFANIIIVPLATLITLCGLSLICVGAFFPLLAQLFSPAAEVLVAALLRVNFFLANLPGACLYINRS